MLHTMTLTELVQARKLIPPVPEDAKKASLSDRFIVPPFSVLDARQGYWQKRKKMWLDLGVSYGVRATGGGNHSFSTAVETRQGGNFFGHGEQGSGKRGDIGRYANQRKNGKCYNMGMDGGDADAEDNRQYSTPVFDPVLCEIMFRWFSPPRGHVVDPFAGTAISGVVATMVGRRYTGIDINPEQVEQNRLERDELCSEEQRERLEWVHGDSADAVQIMSELYAQDGSRGDDKCDLLFSCPPYGDLVQYSDDPRDISTMDYNKFLAAYKTIILETCKCLRDDRFAVYVVGEFRDPKTGSYRGFIGDTVAAHRAAGLELYNDMVLVTAVGSMPLRTGKQFCGSRKVGKGHQNVLVFVKGDPTRATAACGEVDIDDLDMPEPVKDCIAVEWEPGEVIVLDMPLLEQALNCDILRGDARRDSLPIPRVWTCTNGDGWSKVQDHEELTYLVGSTAYLHQSVFPGAPGPRDTPPAPKKLR